MWDFFNKYKFQIYAAAAILALFLLFLITGIYQNGQAKDAVLMAELQKVGYALEGYFGQHRAYPVAQDLNLAGNLRLSDNGFGQPAGDLYYRGSVTGGRASYSSDGDDYTIDFKLRRRWPVVSVSDSKNCQITTNFKISCDQEEKN